MAVVSLKLLIICWEGSGLLVVLLFPLFVFIKMSQRLCQLTRCFISCSPVYNIFANNLLRKCQTLWKRGDINGWFLLLQSPGNWGTISSIKHIFKLLNVGILSDLKLRWCSWNTLIRMAVPLYKLHPALQGFFSFCRKFSIYFDTSQKWYIYKSWISHIILYFF